MFFHSWTDLLRVFAVGAPAYLTLVLILRISGKRTLSKLNAFDLVITIAMGSTLATILLSADVSLAEGVAALALLVLLQFLITWTSVRSSRLRRFVKSEPTLLFYRSQYLEETMRHERITRAEVLAAVRAQGFADLASVGAVVLETDGSLSGVGLEASGNSSLLEGVEGRPSTRG